MASNEIWGIDIGKSSIKAVKMRRVKNQLEVIAIDIVEYEQALSESEDVDREEQIRQAMSEFQARNKIKNDRIFVSIPGQATFNRLITIPPVEAKRIREIVTYEAQQQIPFPIEEVIWDYQVIGNAEKSLEEREVMLFAVRKELINNFLNNLESAQLNVEVQGLQIAPLALYNFIRFERPDMETGVIIDIGAENTDLVIVDSDKLWLRAVPYAGDDVTKALQKRFNIPYPEAEKLKIRSGKTKQSQKIFDVMKPVLKDLVGEIHRSVGYYTSSMSKNIKLEKMVFVGNGTKLNGFQQFFSQNLQYNVEVLSSVKNIHISPKINVNLFQSNTAAFAVALGLAIQGLGKAANDIKLMPADKVLINDFNRNKPFIIAAAALMCAAPIFDYYHTSSLKENLTSINNSILPLKQQIDSLQKRLDGVKVYNKLQDNLESLSTYGKGRSVFLEAVNFLNQQYMESAKLVEESGKEKIWIIGYNFDTNNLVEKTSEEFFNPRTRKKEKRDITKITKSLVIQFSVVFKGLQGNVQSLANNQHLENYFMTPLKEKCKAKYGENFGTIEMLAGNFGLVEKIFNTGNSLAIDPKKEYFKATIEWKLLLQEETK